MKRLIILLLTIVIGLLGACIQHKVPAPVAGYTVDSSITTEVSKKIKAHSWEPTSSADIQIYEDDSLVFDSHNQGKSIEDCAVIASQYNDTISIICDVGSLSGFGYKILLCKDTCIITYVLKSDAEVLRLHKNDDPVSQLNVPCTAYKLTLSRHPSFKIGETLDGIAELTTADYYEDVNAGKKKCRLQLKGWFRTPPTEAAGKK
jgi:hypothetical protein